MNWREERKLLNAFLRAKSPFPAPLDTARRVAKKKRKHRATERVLRWRQRHPKTHLRRKRAYRRAQKRKMEIAAKASAEQHSQPKR